MISDKISSNIKIGDKVKYIKYNDFLSLIVNNIYTIEYIDTISETIALLESIWLIEFAEYDNYFKSIKDLRRNKLNKIYESRR